jgi:hypothetical protein
VKKIIIVKVGSYKTFGINNVLNTIITSFVSNQMRWLDEESNGFCLEGQSSNLGKTFYVQCMLTKYSISYVHHMVFK